LALRLITVLGGDNDKARAFLLRFVLVLQSIIFFVSTVVCFACVIAIAVPSPRTSSNEDVVIDAISNAASRTIEETRASSFISTRTFDFFVLPFASSSDASSTADADATDEI
jgi:hypothetical protein